MTDTFPTFQTEPAPAAAPVERKKRGGRRTAGADNGEAKPKRKWTRRAKPSPATDLEAHPPSAGVNYALLGQLVRAISKLNPEERSILNQMLA
jgi:hypothetical protein